VNDGDGSFGGGGGGGGGGGFFSSKMEVDLILEASAFWASTFRGAGGLLSDIEVGLILEASVFWARFGGDGCGFLKKIEANLLVLDVFCGEGSFCGGGLVSGIKVGLILEASAFWATGFIGEVPTPIDTLMGDGRDGGDGARALVLWITGDTIGTSVCPADNCCSPVVAWILSMDGRRAAFVI
jgi:hypothetical protein